MSIKEIPSKEVTIGDVTYKIDAFLGTKSIKLSTKVLKIVGPSLSEFFKEGSEDDSIGAAVRVFSASLGDDDVTPIVKELLANVTKNGQPLNIDWDFMGDQFSHLPKLLVEVSLFNWGSVFQGFAV